MSNAFFVVFLLLLSYELTKGKGIATMKKEGRCTTSFYGKE